MPAPSRESGRTPPMMAPIAARPELPRNLRRLVWKSLPPAALAPGSRAMMSTPCCPLPGFLGRSPLRESGEREYLRFAPVPQDHRRRRGRRGTSSNRDHRLLRSRHRRLSQHRSIKTCESREPTGDLPMTNIEETPRKLTLKAGSTTLTLDMEFGKATL